MSIAAPRPGPLAGLRVIELAHVMAGPVCGLMLADMGASVIKVEKSTGDDTRRSIPPAIKGEAAPFMMMNRNKRGIVLDLKQPAGAEALRRLVRNGDVLIENYRADTLPGLGLGYDALASLNPRLIYASITGFGRTGPMADQGGFDLVAQGMSGLMAITGEGPGRPPVKVGAPVCDITAGLLLTMGVLAALANRERTGRGQMVDTSLFEAGVTLTYWQSAIALATGTSPGPMGSAHPLNAPYQAFETADGWVNIGAANQNTWLGMLRALGAMHLAEDPRFETGKTRMIHLDALITTLAPLFRPLTTADVLARMQAEGVPAGPVLSVQQMLAHPQTHARGMVPTVQHPVAGAVQTIGLPIKFSATPGGVQDAAPLLGQHTREVLSELGYATADIARMLDTGAAKAV
jgi:crotonobetainyl-CoA:carnitine CoA-transferase CaiB-like acyl-CoA transferase